MESIPLIKNYTNADPEFVNFINNNIDFYRNLNKDKIEEDVEDGYSEYDEDKTGDNYDDDEYYENKPVIEPDVGLFTIPKHHKKYDINGKNVEVIVKLANIILTAENPNYEGGV